MTVADLIEELKGYPQDLEVLSNYDGQIIGGGVGIRTIHAVEVRNGTFHDQVQGYGKDYLLIF